MREHAARQPAAAGGGQYDLIGSVCGLTPGTRGCERRVPVGPGHMSCLCHQMMGWSGMEWNGMESDEAFLLALDALSCPCHVMPCHQMTRSCWPWTGGEDDLFSGDRVAYGSECRFTTTKETPNDGTDLPRGRRPRSATATEGRGARRRRLASGMGGAFEPQPRRGGEPVVRTTARFETAGVVVQGVAGRFRQNTTSKTSSSRAPRRADYYAVGDDELHSYAVTMNRGAQLRVHL